MRDAFYLAAVLVLYAVLIHAAVHRGSADGAERVRAPWEVGRPHQNTIKPASAWN